MADRLYRSRSDRMIAGIAGGMAAATGVDPALVRIGWVILAFVTQGAAILVYFVLVFVIPEQPSAATDGTRMDLAGDRADAAPADTSAPPSAAPPDAPRDASDADAPPSQLPLLLGVGLILIGAWYLVRQLIPAIDFQAVWPLLAIALGGVLVVAALARRR